MTVTLFVLYILILLFCFARHKKTNLDLITFKNSCVPFNNITVIFCLILFPGATDLPHSACPVLYSTVFVTNHWQPTVGLFLCFVYSLVWSNTVVISSQDEAFTPFFWDRYVALYLFQTGTANLP